MTIGTDDLGRITQKTSVVASDGDRLGTIDQVYTSDTTGDPAWVTLKTGLFGTQESFVPLSDATFDGDDIRVAVSKEAVHGAPRVDAGGHLSPDEEDDLYRHYGLHNPDRPEADAGPDDRDHASGDRLVGDHETAGRENADRGLDGDRHEDDTRDRPGAGTEAAAAAGTVGGLAAGTAATAGRDRDDELAARDAEGRDEVVDRPEVDRPGVDRAGSDRAGADDSPGVGDTDRGVHDRADAERGAGAEEAVRPGERTTRLKRYVVTERVVQTVEELPDDAP